MNRLYDKAVFISWMKEVPRSKGIAEALGIRDFYIERMKSAPLWLVPLRYLLQTLETLGVLWRERPKLIIVMNPPIVLPLIVFVACRLLNAEFIIDSHTTAITGKWRRVLFIHRFLSRRALVTLVTNEALGKEVASWRAKAMVLEDRLPRLTAQLHQRNGSFTVGVISRRAEDEPFEAICAAAAELSDYQFLITGRIGRGLAARAKQLPRNVTLTGFLRGPEYVSFLHYVDALMVLDTEDFTMLCGAYEAVAVEKPLITSDWPVLRNYFSLGAIYVDNTSGSICDAVQRVARCREQLSGEMRQLKHSLEHHWNERFNVLRSNINRVLATEATEGGEKGARIVVDGATAQAITMASYSEGSAEADLADR